MTETPHTPPNNPGGDSSVNPATPRTRNTTATRRTRIRGCGVPPNIWFAPHTVTQHEKTRENRTSPNSHRQDWSVEEIVRQFTEPGQHYTVTRIHPHAAARHKPSGETRTAPTLENLEGDERTTPRHPARNTLELILADTESTAGQMPTEQAHGELSGLIEETWEAYLESALDAAKSRLADGGTLAVIPPRPTPGERFLDLSGHTIRNVRDNGFTYLQHIAIVDAHIAEEGITPHLAGRDLNTYIGARAHGVPIHARAHSDLLIFRKLEKETNPLA